MKKTIFLTAGLLALNMAVAQPFSFITPGSLDPINRAFQCKGPYYVITPDADFKGGAIWAPAPIDLTQPFDKTFFINFGSKDGNGADGIAFVFQAQLDPNSSPGTPIGLNSGGFLSFADNIPSAQSINRSVAIEFDTHFNPPGDQIRDLSFGSPPVSVDHIDIFANGLMNLSSSLLPVSPVQASPSNFNIEDGQCHKVRIQWIPGITPTLNVYFDGGLRVTSNTIDIGSIINSTTAWWGFTGGTGGISNLQYISYIGLPDTLKTCASSLVLGGDLYNDPTNKIKYTWTFFGQLPLMPVNSRTLLATQNGQYQVSMTYTDMIDTDDDPLTAPISVTFCPVSQIVNVVLNNSAPFEKVYGLLHPSGGSTFNRKDYLHAILPDDGCSGFLSGGGSINQNGYSDMVLVKADPDGKKLQSSAYKIFNPQTGCNDCRSRKLTQINSIATRFNALGDHTGYVAVGTVTNAWGPQIPLNYDESADDYDNQIGPLTPGFQQGWEQLFIAQFNPTLGLSSNTVTLYSPCERFNVAAGARTTAKKVIRTEDGGFLVVGTIKNAQNGSRDIIVVKLNSALNHMWAQTYDLGPVLDDDVADVVEIPNSLGFVILGNSKPSVNSNNKNLSLLRIDNGGIALWQKLLYNFTFFSNTEGHSIVLEQTSPSSWDAMILGKSYEQGVDKNAMYFRFGSIHLIPVANPQVYVTFVGQGTPQSINILPGQLKLRSGGGVTISGLAESISTGVRSVWLTGVANTYTIAFSKMYRYAANTTVPHFPTSNGFYIVGATGQAYGSPDPDHYIIKATGNVANEGKAVCEYDLVVFANPEHPYSFVPINVDVHPFNLRCSYMIKQLDDSETLEACDKLTMVPEGGFRSGGQPGTIGETTTMMGSVIENEGAGAFLYPNPVQEGQELSVVYKATDARNATVTITDITGRTENSFTTKLSMGENRLTINTSGFKSGVYFVHITTNTGNKTLRFSIID
jgi:hypothetical protein